MRKKFSLKAVLLGTVTVFVGLIFQGVLVGIFVFIESVRLGNSINSIDRLNKISMIISEHQLAIGIFIFTFTSFINIFGGYVAAYFAKHDELFNGTLSSFIAVIFALFGIKSASIIEIGIGIIGLAFFAFIGAYLRLMQKRISPI